jgi:hypothetical protein
MATRQVRYIGHHDAVFVPVLDREVKRREVVEVDAALAANLAEQEENWEIVAPPKKGDKEGGE